MRLDAAIYLAGLVFQWLKKLGGLKKMEELNIAKAKLLYDYLDQTEFYHSPVAKEDRSRMNVPFTLRSDSRAIARSAACARRSITRCRSRA